MAAAVFADPDTWIGAALEIAGDELTEAEIAKTFARVVGRPVGLPSVPIPRSGDPDRDAMVSWFDKEGYAADIPAVRALHPGLLTFEQWVRRTGWI